MTASSLLLSPGFTRGRKDVGIVLSHISIVLLNIPAWCLVTLCKVGCAGLQHGKADSPSPPCSWSNESVVFWLLFCKLDR